MTAPGGTGAGGLSGGAKAAILAAAAVVGIGGGAIVALTGSDDSGASQVETVESTTSSLAETTTSAQTDADTSADDGAGTTAVAGPECNPIASSRAGQALAVIEQWESERFVIQICREAGGQYWYHGRRVDGDPEVDSLTLPTTKAANGYRAETEAGYAYVVASESLIVTDTNDEIVVSEPLVLTGP